MEFGDWVEELAQQPDSDTRFGHLVRDLAAAWKDDIAYAYDSHDGGVDVYLPASGMAWQCKFTGPETRIRDLTSHVKAQIGREFAKLRAQLSPGNDRRQAQFAFWQDRGAVQSYTYATSVRLPNLQARATIRTCLRDEFKKLAKHALLPHLADVNVEVWDRQAIALKIKDHPVVGLRWFKLPLPASIEKFADWKRRRRGNEVDPQKRSFHAYLFSDVLPYKPHPDATKRPATILDVLCGTASSDAVLIHGAGGLGKSRLMAEVAGCADESGWSVFVLAPSAGDDAIDAVARIVADTPALLLLDYAEYCAALPSLYSRLKHLNANGGCRISLLMASRTTAPVDGTVLDDASITRIHITSSRADQYRIIKHMLGAELEDLAAKCMYIPVFAAFIRLLQDRGQVQTLEELRREGDFHSWIRKHVAGPVANKLALARLCSVLSCSDATMTSASQLDARVDSYRQSLLADGWLVFAAGAGNEGWQIAHDLIADGALIELFAQETTASHHANELLKFAAAAQASLQCIRALNRVAEDEQVAKVDWFSILKSQGSVWASHLHEIARGLLVPKDMLCELAEAMGFTTPVLAQNVGLRRVAWLVARDAAVRRRMLSDLETRWIAATFTHSPPKDAALLVGNWLRADTASTEAGNSAMTVLRDHPVLEECGYVLAGWMYSMRPIAEVHQPLKLWLARHNTTPQAVVLIAAWLEHMTLARQDIDSAAYFLDDYAIGSVVERWLGSRSRCKSPQAAHLFRAWILATRDVSTFEKKMRLWLDENQRGFAAQIVLGHLLSYGYPSERLRDYMEAWIAAANNVSQFDAWHLFVSWLRAGGSPSLVREAIQEWLEARRVADLISFAEMRDAKRMMLTTWLEAIGDPGAVSEEVVQWLAHEDNSLSPRAHYIFLSWIKAKGHELPGHSLNWLGTYVAAWAAIEGNAIQFEARFLYSTWLRAGGSPSVVRGPLLQWLAAKGPDGTTLFAESFDGGRMVLTAWLEFAGEAEAVQQYVLQWLEQENNGLSGEAQYVLVNWLKGGGAEEIVRKHLVRWLSRPLDASFPQQEFVLSTWLNSPGVRLADCEPLVKRWCEDTHNAASDRADYLIANWRNAGGERSVVQSAVDVRARCRQIPALLFWVRAPYPRVPIQGLKGLTAQLYVNDRPIVFIELVKQALATANSHPPADLDHLLRRWIEKLGRDGIVVLQDELLRWVGERSKFSEAPFALAELLSYRDIGELSVMVERLAVQALALGNGSVKSLFLYRAWSRSGRPYAAIETSLQAWLSNPTAINNGKCAEILCALQASELGQAAWVLEAIERFRTIHGYLPDEPPLARPTAAP